jgi:hypothetical protein
MRIKIARSVFAKNVIELSKNSQEAICALAPREEQDTRSYFLFAMLY